MAGNVKLTANKALVKYSHVQIVDSLMLIESVKRVGEFFTELLKDFNFSKSRSVTGVLEGEIDLVIEITRMGFQSTGRVGVFEAKLKGFS